MDDDELLAAWHEACGKLAEQRELTKDLHQQVQDRKLGPYAPEAAWSAPAEDEDSTVVGSADVADLGDVLDEGKQA